MQSEKPDQLESYLKELPLPDNPSTLYEPIRYIMGIGGKRIRPRMVLAGCGLCDGDINEAMNAAAAVETLHNFTLIHDDIMDNASKRRGLPTVHAKWDNSTAILSGDALFAYSFELLSYYGTRDTITKEQYVKLNQIFLKASRTVCEGQARDMEFESRADVTLSEYMLMIEQKTAALLQASLQLGAIIGGGTDSQIQMCGDIGLKAGIAFQIQDDLLDAIGDPEKFGKRPGGDIAEGKKTYLSISAMQLANEQDKIKLNQILNSTQVFDDDIDTVIGIYKKYDILQFAQKKIEQLYNEARQSLNTFQKSRYSDEINAMLNQLMSRDH
ncbi:MAG: polyprenyl synthetase family protein [Bacteroidetes bacterium]|nr:polyprenyl synthetase family protein [Bacteroidota bacterium]MCH8523616.1 polyprenyl synthetase family protein [Balneolales bacterium]